ncbi:unnamed protein product [Durusdinium trenchii]|uniref:Uncharacterized protein n=1 Tax=Durusdinium trenchii TaxID=1381693 RepID=A0ABP0NK69_9DINO
MCAPCCFDHTCRHFYPKTTVPAASDQHPAGFKTLREAFRWPDVFLQKVAKHYGTPWLCKRLRLWRWTFSSAFSGVGAPESAVTSLEAAAGIFLESAGARKPVHRKVLFEFTCEIDPHCRKVLMNTYQSPCNWPDITSFNPARKTQYCSTHQKMCPVQKYHVRNRPICTLFSRMGRRTGTDDPRFVTHSSYYDSMKQISDIMIIENVPEYSEEIARQHLVGWSTESVVVDPRVLGVPASRARLYILAFNEATVKRRRDVCFGCTALCCNKHLMTTKSHWFGVGFKSNQVFQVVARNLADYRRLKTVRFPDMSQYPRNGRGRGECADKTLCTLTTSTKLFSEDKKRFVSSKELLSSHILPTTLDQSRICRAPALCLDGVSTGQQSKMAGNSMNSVCVGMVLLAACLSLEPK